MTVSQARQNGFQGNPRKNKYGNKRTLYSGRTYDSKKEAERAIELDILLRAGKIKGWEAQPSFYFEHDGIKICRYNADFKVENLDGTVDIEDVKGVKTAVYRIKKKMLKAFYGIDVKEL